MSHVHRVPNGPPTPFGWDSLMECRACVSRELEMEALTDELASTAREVRFLEGERDHAFWVLDSVGAVYE